MEEEQKTYWKQIANEIHIEVSVDFDASNILGEWAKSVILIPYFGAPKGTFVIPMSSMDKVGSQAFQDKEYTASFFDLDLLDLQDIKGIMDMLSEWGWDGPDADKPDWLTEY